MPSKEPTTQKARLIKHLSRNSVARDAELRAIGISGTAISRTVKSGEISRVGRGLYHLVGAEVDININLAEAAKRAPKAVICLLSALAFHGLTDQMPRKVWAAIGAKDWKPKIGYPPMRIVRFREPYCSKDVEVHDIGGVKVRVYSKAKSIADAFRNPKLVDRSVAIESLKAALSDGRIKPGDLVNAADDFGVGKIMRPYLEALTANGQVPRKYGGIG